MAPYAKIISQVEDVLEENTKSKAHLTEMLVELQRSKAEEERLNCFIILNKSILEISASF